MKIRIPRTLFAAGVAALSALSAEAQTSSIITITEDMLINEENFGKVWKMFDEASNVGDPRGGSPGIPYGGWYPGWNDWLYPAHAIIDLGADYALTDIYIYDPANSGANSLEFSSGSPFAWTSLFVDTLPSDDAWNGHSVNVTTRYLRMTLAGSRHGKLPNEVVIYGTQVGTPPVEPQPVAHTPPLMNEFIGINAFQEDPIGRIQVAGHVREYHVWAWDEGISYQTYPGYPNNENAWASSWAAGGGWNFDRFYDLMNQKGITVAPAIMENALWMVNFDPSKGDTKPVSPGETDATDPFNYVEHADHMWQYAARYGSVQHPDHLLKLKAGEPRISGAGLIEYYENWNEQDKWWKSRLEFFHPYEYAAMSSADYDGHQGAMGTTVGVKNADPNAKLVMGGTAHPSVDYLKMIKFWADQHRGGSVPFDVINVHHYSNTAGGQATGSSIGISPEDDDLKGRMRKLADYRDRYMPGKELWISEFGYDTHPDSIQAAVPIGSFSIEEVQAQWLIRSYLALAAGGVDRAQMYMLRDVDESSDQRFSTSGLTRPKSSDWAPKPSWYYLYTMRNQLGDMRFHSEVDSGNPDVLVYSFEKDGQIAAYSVWCPTSDQTTVSNYVLDLAGNPSSATLVELTVGSINGLESDLPISNNQVTLTVSERPVFVLLDSTKEEFVIDSIVPLSPANVINESGLGDAGNLLDEQSISGNPYFGTKGDVSTGWDTGFQSANYPASMYIDLGESMYVPHLYYYDTNAIGDIEFQVGSPGNWTTVYQEKTSSYNTWKMVPIAEETQYIRVIRIDSNANFNEILIYTGNPPADISGNGSTVWIGEDIGSVAISGNVNVAANSLVIDGEGADGLWGNTDDGYMVHQLLSGDCSITAKVTSQENTHPDAVAGVIVRDSLATNANVASTYCMPVSGVRFYRHNYGDSWGYQTTNSGSAPIYLRLSREGSLFTSESSTDGNSWSTIGSATVNMSNDVYVGLFVSSRTTGELSTAVFDEIAID